MTLASVSVRDVALDHVAHRLAQRAPAVGITLGERLHVRARLLERDVRRQRWHVGIDARLDHDRAVLGERALPAGPYVLGLVHAYAGEAERLGVFRAREVREILRLRHLG